MRLADDDPDERRQNLIVDGIDDLQAYRRLLFLVEELERLSRRCWSVASATALQVACNMIRTLASGLYRAAESSDED